MIGLLGFMQLSLYIFILSHVLFDVVVVDCCIYINLNFEFPSAIVIAAETLGLRHKPKVLTSSS